MPMIFYSQEKAFLSLDKFTNLVRAKSFITQNRFAFQIYFTQKFCGTLRIMNISAGQQQSYQLEIFSDEGMNFGSLAATRYAYCLIAQNFASPGSVPVHFAKGRINLNEQIFVCISDQGFQDFLEKILRTPLTEFHKIALKTVKEFKLGRPFAFGAGNNGAITSSCLFVRQYLS